MGADVPAGHCRGPVPPPHLPWLAARLATWDPADQPKYFRIVCGHVVNGRAGPQPCPQPLGTAEPAGAGIGLVGRATKQRALDGLPPVKPTDWIVSYDGWYDLEASGAYLPVKRRPRSAQLTGADGVVNQQG